MHPSEPEPYTAFAGVRHLAAGNLAAVAQAAKQAYDAGSTDPVLVFDGNGRRVDLDLRGSPAEVLERLPQPPAAPSAPRGPGRPRLGVVAREVTLLPRHWDWLAGQPGGASVTLRKLVDAARRTSGGPDRIRQAQEAGYRFLSALAGDRPGYEEALRALFAGDEPSFQRETAAWPADVREHAWALTRAAFPSAP